MAVKKQQEAQRKQEEEAKRQEEEEAKRQEEEEARRQQEEEANKTVEEPKVEAAAASVISVVKAIADFASDQEGDLTFSVGDMIEVIENIDENWSRGRIGEREGIFPATFVESSDAEASTQTGVIYRVAIADFPGENEGDLAFAKDDKIEIVALIDENWATGRIGEREGLVPLSFLQ